MATFETDDLLEALAVAARDREQTASDASPEGERVDDALVDDYRQGRLDADAARVLEARLATDPTLRANLATTAGVRVSPPGEIRNAVLGSFNTESGAVAESGAGAPVPQARRRGWSLAAAAVFVMAILSAQLFQRGSVNLTPLDVWAEVSETRAGDPGQPYGDAPLAGPLVVEVEPDQPFSIGMTPTLRSEEGVDVGLYRRGDRGLERIDGSELVRRNVVDGEDSGYFVVRHPARALAGADALWVVVGYEGSLDAWLEVDSNLDAAGMKAAMESTGDWLLYRTEVNLRDPSSSEPSASDA